MPTSVFDNEVQGLLDQAQTVGGTLFPSPEEWQDQCIYFLMVDRFNNPGAPPRNLPFDAEFSQFQGGTFNGIKNKLHYLGVNQQKALKFHVVLAKLLPRKAYRRFSISQILAAFRGGFLRTYNLMESINFSSAKSYSPCRLK